MLSYFRVNDPYRLAIIFLFLVFIRITIFFDSFPEHIAELKWMVIGEKLADSNTLYVDIWDNIEPFTAMIYWIINEFFDRSTLTAHILSLFLVFVQAVIFNNILITHRSYNESSYLPAFLYILLMSLFYDFYLLSPAMIGLTFIMLAIENVIVHLGEKRNDQMILETGIYLGVANLFYYPSFIFLLMVILSYSFITATTFRRYVLLIFGYVFPIVITSVYYYIKGGAKEFYVNFITSIFNIKAVNYLGPQFYLILISFPLIFIVLAILKTFQSNRFNNQQERIQKLFLIYSIGAVLCWFVNKNRFPYQLIIAMVPAAFFLTHYFLNIRSRWKAELVFTFFVLGILFLNVSSYKKLSIFKSRVDLDKIEVQNSQWDDLIRDKKILYLGENYSIYKNSRLATPYFNWDLSRLHLNNYTYFDNITAIHNNFKNDMPEVIIDEFGIMKDIFEKMPIIKAEYRVNAAGQVYELIPREK